MNGNVQLELVARCGCEIFVQHRYENNHIWTYCSNDTLWGTYQATGIQPQVGHRLSSQGRDAPEPHVIQHPTPTKSGVGDCNFVCAIPINISEII